MTDEFLAAPGALGCSVEEGRPMVADARAKVLRIIYVGRSPVGKGLLKFSLLIYICSINCKF